MGTDLQSTELNEYEWKGILTKVVFLGIGAVGECEEQVIDACIQRRLAS